jgi:hypothetical protein
MKIAQAHEFTFQFDTQRAPARRGTPRWNRAPMPRCVRVGTMAGAQQAQPPGGREPRLIALLAESRPIASLRPFVNHLLAMVTARTDAMAPVALPTTTPHSRSSCQGERMSANHTTSARKSPAGPCRCALLLYTACPYSRPIRNGRGPGEKERKRVTMLYAILAMFVILSVVSFISGHVASR